MGPHVVGNPASTTAKKAEGALGSKRMGDDPHHDIHHRNAWGPSQVLTSV